VGALQIDTGALLGTTWMGYSKVVFYDRVLSQSVIQKHWYAKQYEYGSSSLFDTSAFDASDAHLTALNELAIARADDDNGVLVQENNSEQVQEAEDVPLLFGETLTGSLRMTEDPGNFSTNDSPIGPFTNPGLN
jgi:hypothetical protein